MTRRVGLERLLALFAIASGLAADSGQFESKHADRDAAADTDPQSAFWRGVPAVMIENDARGNPVPGYRTEVRSRWTAGNLYFLFICPFQRLNLKPDPKTQTETNELWKWDVAHEHGSPSAKMAGQESSALRAVKGEPHRLLSKRGLAHAPCQGRPRFPAHFMLDGPLSNREPS